MDSMLIPAKKYHQAGFNVLKLAYKGKNPSINWKRFETESQTEEEVDHIFSNNMPCNIGIVCGQVSNLVVIDFDDKNLINILKPEDTYTVQTRKGFHYYYHLPDFEITGFRIPSKLDVQFNGTQVVAPPSLHASGHEYKAIGNGITIENIPTLTEALWQKLQALYYFYVLNKETVREINIITEGGRNNTLTELIGRGCSAFSSDKWEDELYPLFLRLNEMLCIPIMNIDECSTIFHSILDKEYKKRNDGIGNFKPTKKLENKYNIKQDFKILKAIDLLNIDNIEFPYLIDKLIPEKAITAITADSGKGKSLFMMILVKYLLSGQMAFEEYKVKKSNVLIIDQEMDIDLLANRYKEVIGEDFIGLNMLCEQEWQINNEGHYNWLVKFIIEKKINIIIFDTLTQIHTSSENSADEMKLVNKRMLELIKTTGVTIVYLHHHRKTPKGEKLSQASSRGSTEIIAKVSSHLLIESQKKIEADNSIILEMTVSQEKARRPESIGKISLDITYKENKTTWEFKGEEALKRSAELVIENEILDFMFKNLHNKNGWTVKDLTIALDRQKSCLYPVINRLFDTGKIISIGKKGNAILYILAEADEDALKIQSDFSNLDNIKF